MSERTVEIRTSDGVAEGVLYWTEDAGPRPGVLHFTDIRGLRPAPHDMAERLCAAGYTVLQPNIFYRSRRPPMFDFPFDMKEERGRARFAELTQPLTPDAMEHDAHAYVDFLAADPQTKAGPLGVVGYCFSGGFALRVAAALPERIAAAASFHGGGLWKPAPDSPHLLLPRVKAELFFGHAVEDHSMPADAIAQLDRALSAWGGRYRSEVFGGARHGWTVPDSAAYNETQAERAYTALTSLLARNLS